MESTLLNCKPCPVWRLIWFSLCNKNCNYLFYSLQRSSSLCLQGIGHSFNSAAYNIGNCDIYTVLYLIVAKANFCEGATLEIRGIDNATENGIDVERINDSAHGKIEIIHVRVPDINSSLAKPQYLCVELCS